MSVYGIIVGGVVTLVGVASSVSASVAALTRSRQIENPTEKRSLYVASVFIGLSILFAVLTILSAFRLSSASQKNKKRRKILLLVCFILLAISIISGLVTLAVLRNVFQKSGRESEATGLNVMIYLVVTSLVLYLIGFIILYVFLARKLRKFKV